MKALAIPTKLAVFATTLLVASVLSLQAQPQPVTAKVRAVRGAAKYSDNGTWHTLRVNDVLQPGSVIETGRESTVDLFVNNSVIRITPETTFGITKASATDTGAETVTDTELYIKSGRVLGNVKKLAAASKYQIKTPNGVTGIRGTEWEVIVVPNGTGGSREIVRCINGTLIISAVNSRGEVQTVVINTGESWSFADGITPTPVDLDLPVPPFDENDSTPPIPQPDRVIIFEEPDLGNGVSPNTP